MTPFTESTVEQAALDALEGAGWCVAYGARVAPGEPAAERDDYHQVLLQQRLRGALARLNPEVPAEALRDAYRKLTRPDGADLVSRNRVLHRMLVDGVSVDYRNRFGDIRGAQVRVLDFDEPAANDWLAINQFTVVEGAENRRPDIVLFVNGLPLGVIELKNAADEKDTMLAGFRQLQTYKALIGSLMVFNELLVTSDGTYARVGTLTSGREWFKPWRTIDGQELADTHLPEQRVVIEGLLRPAHMLALIRDFIVFEDDGSGTVAKKMAGYHQFGAVRAAVEETLRSSELCLPESTTAPSRDRSSVGIMPIVGRAGHLADSDTPAAYERLRRLGDRRVGVVWHTQGSGKSLTMAFYAGRIIREPLMQNPTVVVLTDRNDLDDQLFGTFSRCQALLRQPPVQAVSRAHLRDLLCVEAGGVVFTTIQKFFPEERGDRQPVLSDRTNIVVIADEAHRSQYDFIDGYARHMHDALPHASFIGFTGTPIELRDANTRAVFGDYISIYDIQRSVEDGATVPIYYESRLAKLALDESERPRIDPEFEEVTEGEEVERKEKLKTKWAQLEAVVGSQKRLDLVAQDIVRHFEARATAMLDLTRDEGKGMIVCMSRRICVDLYRELARLRPEWTGDDDDTGAVKVIMTGSASDPLEWQPHIRNKARREAMARRFRDVADPFRLVIVRDMWLTGFDAPSLHTMYLDKPMRGHGLMQAIARVNRVFRNKPGGVVVDYLGLAQELRQALATYTESGGKGKAAVDQREAVALMLEKFEVCRNLMHGFDWTMWMAGTPQERLGLLPYAQEHVLAQDGGKDRFVTAVIELSQAFTLSVPHREAVRIRDDVAFFQTVQAGLVKRAAFGARPEEELDHAVRQIISRAVAPEGVVDIFAAAGLKRPDISVLSDEFLAEVRGMPQRNLAVELLEKLLKGELSSSRKKNVVQARSFAEMLERTIRGYQSRAIEAAQVIEELIELAKRMRESHARGEALGLSDDELAFYDALATSDTAVSVLGDEALRQIAQELVKTVRNNVTIDWTLRENVQAALRVLVKRILRKHGYPSDKQEKATQTVLEQAALLSAEWAA